jgi:hypothetical protein
MDEPIACSLSAREYGERAAEMTVLAGAALLAREPLAHGVRLTFDARDATRGRLRAIVAAESACCPFLDMQLREDAGRLRLEITGPDDAAPIIAALFHP